MNEIVTTRRSGGSTQQHAGINVNGMSPLIKRTARLRQAVLAMHRSGPTTLPHPCAAAGVSGKEMAVHGRLGCSGIAVAQALSVSQPAHRAKNPPARQILSATNAAAARPWDCPWSCPCTQSRLIALASPAAPPTSLRVQSMEGHRSRRSGESRKTLPPRTLDPLLRTRSLLDGWLQLGWLLCCYVSAASAASAAVRVFVAAPAPRVSWPPSAAKQRHHAHHPAPAPAPIPPQPWTSSSSQQQPHVYPLRVRLEAVAVLPLVAHAAHQPASPLPLHEALRR